MARGSQAGINGRGGRGAIDGDGDSGSGTVSLTATYVGFGSGANAVTGDPDFTWNNTAKRLSLLDAAVSVYPLFIKPSDTLNGRTPGFIDFDVIATDSSTVTLDCGTISGGWASTEGTPEYGTLTVAGANGLNLTSGTGSGNGGVDLSISGVGAIVSARTAGATVYLAPGTASLPALSVLGDVNTGIFWVSADALGISAGGTLRVTVASATTTVANALTVTGTLTANQAGGVYSAGPYFAPNGTAGAPSFALTNSPTTGFYRIGADQLGFSVAGVLKVGFYGNGTEFSAPLFLSNGTVTNPALAFGGDAGQDTGIYLVAANDMGFTCGGALKLELNATGVGFFATAPIAKQTGGANVTNGVTAGGTSDTIADYSSLTVYATDAAAIRNNLYQLARLVKQDHDALRAYGLLT